MDTDDYYGCPNCNGEGTLDETTYCTCELGQDMEHQHRIEEQVNTQDETPVDHSTGVSCVCYPLRCGVSSSSVIVCVTVSNT
jgi:radical SAM superfamily enzyme